MTPSQAKQARESLERCLLLFTDTVSQKLSRGDKLTDTELRGFVSLCKDNKVTINQDDSDSMDDALTLALMELSSRDFEGYSNDNNGDF